MNPVALSEHVSGSGVMTWTTRNICVELLEEWPWSVVVACFGNTEEIVVKHSVKDSLSVAGEIE